MRTVRRTAIVAAATADSADWVLESSCEPTANGAASRTTMNATEANRPRPPRKRITFEAYRRPRSAPTYRTYPGRVPKRSRTGQQFAHHPPRTPFGDGVLSPAALVYSAGPRQLRESETRRSADCSRK